MTRAVALDGVHLWITLDAPSAGAFVAVDEDSGEEAVFSVSLEPGAQTVLLAMSELPGDGQRSYQLIFRGDGQDHVLFQSPRGDLPTMAPLSPDGRVHFRVLTREDGLRLRRVLVEERATVHRVGVVDGQLEVVVERQGVAEFVLQDERGSEALVEPAIEIAGRMGFRIGGDLRALGEGTWQVMVRDRGRLLPLSRADDDLVAPNAAVVMPEVTDGHLATLLRWSPRGLLQIRRKRRQ